MSTVAVTIVVTVVLIVETLVLGPVTVLSGTSSLVLVETELAEPYPRDEEDNITLLSLLVLKEDVASEDKPEVDDVSADVVDEEVKRLVGMGRRVVKVEVSIKEELLLEDPVELLAVDATVEPVPGIFPDEVDVPP